MPSPLVLRRFPPLPQVKAYGLDWIAEYLALQVKLEGPLLPDLGAALPALRSEPVYHRHYYRRIFGTEKAQRLLRELWGAD
jgi:hypothetical protein